MSDVMMMGKKLATRSVLAAVTALVLQTACGVEVIGDETGGETTIPASVQAAFDRSCATAGCHDEQTRASALSLAGASSAAIFEIDAKDAPPPGMKMLELGSLAESYLALKMLSPDLPEGTSITGTVMPPFSTDASRADVDLILKWIESGEDPDPSVGDAGSSSSSSTTGGSGSTGETGGDDACLEPDGVASGDLTLADHIQPIFDARCATAGCHNSSGIAPRLDASGAASGLNNVDAANADMVLVKPGEPNESYLWRKIEGTHDTVSNGGGGVMPPKGAGPELCESDSQAIRDWIAAGAK